MMMFIMYYIKMYWVGVLLNQKNNVDPRVFTWSRAIERTGCSNLESMPCNIVGRRISALIKF